MLPKKSLYSFYLIFLGLIQFLNAQPVFRHIEKLNSENGLSSSNITTLLQDKNGFLWITTTNGLNRYDGTEVKNFFKEKGIGNLSSNIIYKAIHVNDSAILLATKDGFTLLNTKSYTFQKIAIEDTQKDADKKVYSQQIIFLEKDKADNIWAASPSCIFKINKTLHLEKIFYTSLRASEMENSRKRNLFKMIPLATGEMIFWMHNGVYIWEPQNSNVLSQIQKSNRKQWRFLHASNFNQCFQVLDRYFIFIDYKRLKIKIIDELTGRVNTVNQPKKLNEPIPIVRNIVALKNNWLAISYETNGFICAQLQQNGDTIIFKTDNKIQLPTYTINDFLEDQSGNIWMSTIYNGLLKAAPEKQQFNELKLMDDKNKIASNYRILSFFKNQQSVWMSSFGDGFYEWHLPTKKLVHYSVKLNKTFQNIVWNIRRHQGDTLWLGTQKGIVWFHRKNLSKGYLVQAHPKILDSVPVTTQFVDSKGLIWMGLGRGNGVCMYNPFTKLFKVFPNADDAYPFRYPLFIAEDKLGNLWFSSDATAHLAQWIRKENKFKKIVFPEFKGLNFVQFGGLYVRKNKGEVWFGVQNVGLVCYHIESGVLKKYGKNEGLISDIIFSIISDRNERLWLSTSLGISCFNSASEQFVNYTAKHGLPANYFTAKMFYDSAANQIYAGAQGVVTFFNPLLLQSKKENTSPTITEVLINNAPFSIPLNRKINLSAKSNNINISFTGVNLTNGEENRYAYRLHDNEKWIEIGKQRQIRFAELSPGIYHFSVRVAAKGGDWSVLSDSLAITIRKPYYATFWFYLLIGIGSFLLAYSFYRYRLSQIRQTLKMRSQISHDLHDEIGSRLTNITMMSHILKSRKMDVHQQEQWLDKIQNESEQISQNLREIVWNINPNNDSLEVAMPRMLKYAADILEAKGITVQAKIPKLKKAHLNMQQRRNLFFIFKEAIQNILKHADAQKVSINVSIESNIFKIEIRDDGKGFEKNEQFISNGLSYMRQRAAQFKWNLEIESQPKQGTQIYLEIKIT